MADSSALKPVYLICGSDQPKVRAALARLRQRVVTDAASELNVIVFDGNSDSVGSVLETANTPTFMLGPRLLVVLFADKWKPGDRQKVAEYAADPAPDTCLALVGGTFPRTEPLTKTLEKTHQVLRFEKPKRSDLPAWVRERARSRRLTMGSQEVSYLIRLIGEHPDLLAGELDKLALYVDGAPVTVADIDAVCSPTVEARIFELTDAVGSRNGHAAYGALETLYAHGEEAPAIFYALLRHLRQLERVSDMPADLPATELARALGVRPFTATKLAQQRANFSRRSLGRAVAALAEAEVRLRGGLPLMIEVDADARVKAKGGAAFALDTQRETERLVLELALAGLVGERREI